jgi:glycosyltransferase involved in cell wall biosynthesis
MRIGIMLRHYEQQEGGVKVYTQNLLPRIFLKDLANRYVLLYQNPALLGTYATYPNVEEIAIPIPGTVLWDQLAAPWVAKKKHLDIIFNPKFAIPLLSQPKKVFVLHGSEWFVRPWAFQWNDRIYRRFCSPLYYRYADAIVSVSQNSADDLLKYAKIKKDKVHVIHHGFNDKIFCHISDSQQLETIRTKYNLPQNFILFVGQIYPEKNFGGIIKAFVKAKKYFDHKLVVAGEIRGNFANDVHLIHEYGIQDDVLFIGWISQKELAVVYNLADLFVFPSFYEGFGIPLLEAMACGCPIITSKTGSPPEVVGNAAVLIDPSDSEGIASAIQEILNNRNFRDRLIEDGFKRAKGFSWDSCAENVIKLFGKLEKLRT